MSEIGRKIKELRLLSGISQEALGKRVGVQRAAINKYEKGTVENISIKTIEKMADVFNVNPNYIVGWNGRPNDALAVEVKVLQGVKRFYGESTVDLIEDFIELTPTGKRRVLQYAGDMLQVYGEERKTT